MAMPRSIGSEEKKKKDSTSGYSKLNRSGRRGGTAKEREGGAAREVGEKPKERMGEGKFKTVSVGDAFKGICCEVEQRNGTVAGSGIEVKSRLCIVFFKDEGNNSKFVWWWERASRERKFSRGEF